jgi:hypothetical protein
VNLLIGLLKPPTKEECVRQKLLTPAGEPITASLRGKAIKPAAGSSFAGLAKSPFGGQATQSSTKSGKG